MLVAGLVGVTSSQGRGDAASARNPMIFGAVGSSRAEIQSHERALGRQMVGYRLYRKWGQPLFGKDHIWARDTGHVPFLSVNASGRGGFLRWAAIASAQPGSRLYNDLVSMARQIRDYRSKVYFIFQHEPEQKGNRKKGSPAQFAAAWRKVVTVFRNQGVKNAEYVLTMTAWGFKRKDAHNARHYYPGDAYVDHIAGDAYNWNGCRGERRGRWVPMEKIISGLTEFGREHPTKGLMLMEWGSVEDRQRPGRKAAWIKDTQELFKRPEYGQYKAILQWGGRSGAGLKSCPFDYITSSSATRAWREMGNDPAYVGRST